MKEKDLPRVNELIRKKSDFDEKKTRLTAKHSSGAVTLEDVTTLRLGSKGNLEAIKALMLVDLDQQLEDVSDELRKLGVDEI